MPAMDSAPAGSRMDRVSWNTSLIAAQIASVSTSTISSTYCLHSRRVSSPTIFTAVPSENRPTSCSCTRRPAAIERAIASESVVCTPITLISGASALMYAATPEINPPPPIATKTEWIGPSSTGWCWRRISIATVPWPAMTSGSSNGWTKVSLCFFCSSSA